MQPRLRHLLHQLGNSDTAGLAIPDATAVRAALRGQAAVGQSYLAVVGELGLGLQQRPWSQHQVR